MKFYTLLNNKDLISQYKMHLKIFQQCIKSKSYFKDFKLQQYNKDLSIIKKSLSHNLILFNHESNPNIYYLMTKTSKLRGRGFDSPRNGFESSETRRLIEINQVENDLDLGYAKCLFLVELKNSNEINNLLIPLDESIVKESFGSLENAENLYKSAQKFYELNKNNSKSWVDVTRYFTRSDEIYKQYSYINFMEHSYYPFKLNDNIYEYNEANKVDKKALELVNISLKRPSEEL